MLGLVMLHLACLVLMRQSGNHLGFVEILALVIAVHNSAVFFGRFNFLVIFPTVALVKVVRAGLDTAEIAGQIRCAAVTALSGVLTGRAHRIGVVDDGLAAIQSLQLLGDGEHSRALR